MSENKLYVLVNVKDWTGNINPYWYEATAINPGVLDKVEVPFGKLTTVTGQVVYKAHLDKSPIDESKMKSVLRIISKYDGEL